MDAGPARNLKGAGEVKARDRFPEFGGLLGNISKNVRELFVRDPDFKCCPHWYRHRKDLVNADEESEEIP